MLPLQEERALVKKAKGGSQEAFTELVVDCSDKLRGSLFQRLKNDDQVSEVYQQSLVKSWKKIKTFKGEARFYTWIYRIAANLCYDLFRKRMRENTSSLDALSEENPHIESLFVETKEQHHASREMEMNELGDKLDEALSGLSENHRIVLELFGKENLTYEEISKKTKLPLGTVMSRLFYAKKKARKHYERVDRKRETQFVREN
jgi:RNA polymerase sigma-70 factor (ECF subfamily)